MSNTCATGLAEGLGLAGSSGKRPVPTTRLGLRFSCVACSASTTGSGTEAGGLGLGEVGGDLTFGGGVFRVFVIVLPFTVEGLGGLPSRGWLDGGLEEGDRPAGLTVLVVPAVRGRPRGWLAAAGVSPSTS